MAQVLSLAGINPESMGLHMSNASERPILPATRDRTLTIPGRNGAWDFGADMEPREFNLDCAFIAQSPEKLQFNAEKLARLLVDAHGKPRTVRLVFSVHPDRTYTVRYSGSWPIERLAGMGRFKLPLIAYDPYALGNESYINTTLTASPAVITIQSPGDVETEPVIVLTNQGGVINGFTISNEHEID